MTRGAESFFYHTDHLGSVRLVTDGAGTVANRYDYDDFGNQEATSYETVASPFGFTARERDAESGLMFYRARYYDPRIGRFISEDPIGFEAGDLNLYRYVSNLPLMMVDPEGAFSLAAFTVGAIVGAAIAAVIIHLEEITEFLGTPLYGVSECEIGLAKAAALLTGAALLAYEGGKAASKSTAGAIGLGAGLVLGVTGAITVVNVSRVCSAEELQPYYDKINEFVSRVRNL